MSEDLGLAPDVEAGELAPVSFKLGKSHYLPRLSPPRVPGKHSSRWWSEADDAIIRQYYPDGGYMACAAHLSQDKSGKLQIYLRAQKLGVKSNKTKNERAPIVAPPNIDDILRHEYEQQDGKKRGAINAIADRLGLPRYWVTTRAIKLGLTMPHKKEPPWTAAEEKLLAAIPLHDLERAAKIFREHGFQRSPTAIKVRSVRKGISRRFHDGLSAASAAPIVGFDPKTLTTYIIDGALKAEKRNDSRLPQQGGSRWVIKPEDLRRFVLEHIERVDMRKVDKVAFVHLLAGEGAQADQWEALPASADDAFEVGVRCLMMPMASATLYSEQEIKSRSYDALRRILDGVERALREKAAPLSGT